MKIKSLEMSALCAVCPAGQSNMCDWSGDLKINMLKCPASLEDMEESLAQSDELMEDYPRWFELRKKLNNEE